MYIIPAIDLRDGKCVRLIQGQYDRQINYRDNPVEQAREFSSDGAKWLHIVDLDGAKLGKPVNTDTISAIATLGILNIGKIVLGLDAKGSKVATHGWTQDSSLTILEFAAEAAKLPLAAIIYTDIAKDGMMSGPNFERTKSLVEAVDVPVVASGGVNTVEDIRKLTEFSPEAAIIGRSLYEGTLKFTDAIEAAKR